MVKHPKYQAMDDARQSEIPAAFKRYATDDYECKEIEPVIPDAPYVGPIPRPTFEIFDKDRKKVATFFPNGYSECFDENFHPIFDKMASDCEARG